jgi:hypothetical protein
MVFLLTVARKLNLRGTYTYIFRNLNIGLCCVNIFAEDVNGFVTAAILMRLR